MHSAAGSKRCNRNRQFSSIASGLWYIASMGRHDTRRNLPTVVFFSLMAISLAGLLLLPSIKQDQSYHQFADQRTIFGIPNFWNVVSNLPFLAVGAVGFGDFVTIRQQSSSSSECF